MPLIRTHVRVRGQPAPSYPGPIVTLREFESRDEPRKAVVGTPDDVAPPEWIPGPVTNRERAFHVARGLPAVVGVIKSLVAAVAAVGSAFR